MKTLDDIINNAEYERINGALVERSYELAVKIRNAMRSAEITEIGDYSIRTVTSNSNYSDTSLYIEGPDADYNCEYRSLEDEESHYYLNDFNCWIEAAIGSDRLKFLNDAKSILEKIESIKQKRMSDVKKALKDVEGL